jgi:multidrug efflux pump subunit AcrA (membrane-fusion protein)
MSKALWIGGVALTVIAAGVLYKSGVVGPKSDHATRPTAPRAVVPPPTRTANALRSEIETVEEVVGTVSSRKMVVIAAQLTSRIVELRAELGDSVHAGDRLVVLDDREFAARLAQAREGATAAQAAVARFEQVQAQAAARLERERARFERTKKLLADGSATPAELETSQSDYTQADASVSEAKASIASAAALLEQARSAVTEAEIALEHTHVTSPIDGVVAERVAEPGELAWPGRSLMTVLDPNALRFEARVREGLIARVALGSELDVDVPAANQVVRGRVAEITPAADPRSRTFAVRVAFEARQGVLPGMFGRLRIAGVKREIVSVPATAVARVGQIETVIVHEGERWTRRMVTTGAKLGDGSIEVLSGLAGGEVLGLELKDM